MVVDHGLFVGTLSSFAVMIVAQQPQNDDHESVSRIDTSPWTQPSHLKPQPNLPTISIKQKNNIVLVISNLHNNNYMMGWLSHSYCHSHGIYNASPPTSSRRVISVSRLLLLHCDRDETKANVIEQRYQPTLHVLVVVACVHCPPCSLHWCCGFDTLTRTTHVTSKASKTIAQ